MTRASGGVPKRLTYYPAPDEARGWTPDGKRILFLSPCGTYSGVPGLYTVGLEGGFPEPLPLPTGSEDSYAPDGARIAVVPMQKWQSGW